MECEQTERGLCGLHISQSPHSICMHSSTPACTCRLPVSPRFENTCSYTSYDLGGFQFFLNANASAMLFPHPKSVRILLMATRRCVASNSPVLCWAGCWATVSLLALCPMLWLLSLLACQVLPLQRPTAGEENLKPPCTSPTRHSSCNPKLSWLLTCVV